MVPVERANSLVEIGQRMDQHAWVPGSAGNLSARIDESRIAITRSGVHKGRLTPADIIAVDYDGQALIPGQKPSAETLLHCQLYRLFPQIGAVLHGHSVAATVLSMLGPISFSNYEILKAFGFATHELDVILPVYENDQDIARLAAFIEPLILREPPIGYVIAGHGVYAWGTSVEHAFWRLEALEFLLTCELERRRIK
jgi:methylthioribulose-1-phosphate dehydratase